MCQNFHYQEFLNKKIISFDSLKQSNKLNNNLEHSLILFLQILIHTTRSSNFKLKINKKLILDKAPKLINSLNKHLIQRLNEIDYDLIISLGRTYPRLHAYLFVLFNSLNIRINNSEFYFSNIYTRFFFLRKRNLS